MTLEQIEREQERFEACEIAQDLDLTRQVDGDGYLYYPTSVCWLAWLARAQEAMPALPPGWVAVPVEPTDDMLRDGAAKLGAFFERHGLYPDSRAVYRAMLAAAPPCPAVTLPDGFPWSEVRRAKISATLRVAAAEHKPLQVSKDTAKAIRAIARWLDQSPPEQGGQG